MINKALWCAFAAWAAALPALAAEANFQFARQIKTPAEQQEDLLAVALDSDVFAATQDGLADLRLLDGEGKAVPYLLHKVQTTRLRRVRKTWPARRFSALPLDDGGLEITVELEEDDPQPNGLTLVSPLRNFEQRVRVDASTDGRQWEPVGKEALIFDYSRYMDVRRDSIPFAETAKRHFRIVIDDVTVEQESQLLALTRRLQGADETERSEKITVDRRPLRIERIDFWREVEDAQTTGDEKAKYPVSGVHVLQDTANHRTVIRIDTRRQPLTSFKLETSDRNFSRRAVIEAESEGAQTIWRQIGEATLSRIDFKDVQREDLSISFPQSRQAKHRIVIDDRDSPPLSVKGVEAEGNVYELVYLASPAARCQLLYGSAAAEAAAYDTAAIQELLRSGFQPSRAELGAQQPGPGAGQPPEFKPSELLNNPLLLGGVILLLVLALGWGLVQAVKRMEKLPSE